jgi:hypothetical protein
MTRARLILGSLLPVFWLLGVATCQSESEFFATGGSLASFSAAKGQGDHNPTDLAQALHQATLRFGRRVNLQSGPSGCPAPIALSQSTTPQPENGSFVRFPDGFGLANNWQFHWRTALDPRAPSLVS